MTDAQASPGPIPADPETISRLSDVPRLFKLGLKQLTKIRRGALTLILPDGRTLEFSGREAGPQAQLEIRDYAVVRKVLSGGDVGFGEAYMEGLWTSPDISRVLEVFSANLDSMDGVTKGGPVTRFVNWMIHRLRPNTKRGARRNIEAHYDLGNDFYELWLDPSMTYSSARFATPDQSLEDAQREKYAALARSIGLKKGDHVLEIGCGWGGFAEYAAKEVGARVT